MKEVKARINITRSMIPPGMNLKFYMLFPKFDAVDAGDLLYKKNCYYVSEKYFEENLWRGISNKYFVRIPELKSGIFFPENLYEKYFITKSENRNSQIDELINK